MKRVWRFPPQYKFRDTRSLFCLSGDKIIAKPSVPFQYIRQCATQSPDSSGNNEGPPDIISLFPEAWSYCNSETILKKNLREKVSKLRGEILEQSNDMEKIGKVLEENCAPIFRIHSDGSAVVELLSQLKSNPYLALEVLNWRRKQVDYAAPMTVEEYAKGIVIAGRLKNVELAVELFTEAFNKRLIRAPLFNALMSAYTYNDMPLKVESVFRRLKAETLCSPSIVTYNILISVYGRMTLIDLMEEILMEIKDSNLDLTLQTYRGLISGYLTAWMWPKMEKTYLTMKAGPVKPDLHIHMLMVRGYAHSGQLEKMEEIYETIRENIGCLKAPLVANMIRAYCRSSITDRVEKVEDLLRQVPTDDCSPWLKVLLIRLYAEEGLVEQMEKSINEAFECKICVTTAKIMRCIITNYFRHNAVDKLADFVHRAELAGWKMCRSLYHCKMVMYSSEKRLSEMEKVLDEMSRVNMPVTNTTLWILFKAYLSLGKRNKLSQVIGMMCKQGYDMHMEPFIEILS